MDAFDASNSAGLGFPLVEGAGGFDLEGAVFIFVFVGFGDEFKRAEHVAVVCDGQGRHSVLDGFFIEALDRGGAIQEGKLCMCM